MSRPARPVADIKADNKNSRRTKAEIALREEGEKALLSGVRIFERSEVKSDKIAHAEFLRLNKLMKTIGKNDALYGPVINRYCMLHSECADFQRKREMAFETAEKLKKAFDELDDVGYDEMSSFAKQIAALHRVVSGYDAMLMQKRKMMLDIEKENCMTVAAALRSIPKTPEKEENPLIKALMED